MDETVSPARTEVKTAQGTSTGYTRYVFWVMFAISFLNYMDRLILTGGANQIAKELGFQLDGIGYITSAFLVVYTLVAVPVGIWADRVKRKNVIALCVAVWSVATALTALATNFTTLFLARMILGVGEAGYFPAGTALMGDYYDRSRRARIMSGWSIAMFVGILGGFGIGGAVAGLYTGAWRLAFIFTGIPGLLLAFLAWRIREPRRNQADEDMVGSSSVSDSSEEQENSHSSAIPRGIAAQMKALITIKTLIVLTLMQMFAYFVLGILTAFISTYLQQKDSFGLSSGQAGIFSGVLVVGASIVGSVIGGFLSDLIGRRYAGARVLICGLGFLVASPLFVLAMSARDLRSFTIFFALMAMCLTIYPGPSTAATQDVAPSILRASATGLSTLIFHLFGDAFSPAILGFVATNIIDPTHGVHFQMGLAGHDLSTALLIICTPCLVVSGLIGIFGSRWMGGDVATAERANKQLVG